MKKEIFICSALLLVGCNPSLQSPNIEGEPKEAALLIIDTPGPLKAKPRTNETQAISDETFKLTVTNGTTKDMTFTFMMPGWLIFKLKRKDGTPVPMTPWG